MMAIREVEKTRLKYPNKKGVAPNADSVAEIHRRALLERMPQEERDKVKSEMAPTPYPPKPGKKREFNEETKTALKEHFLKGGSYQSFCKSVGLSVQTVLNWVNREPEYKQELELIRRTAGADALAAEALRIATTPFIQEK